MTGRSSGLAWTLALALPFAIGWVSVTGAQAAPADGCISARAVTGVYPRDDRRIDFRLKGGTEWRNDLPANCRGLNYEADFDYIDLSEEICPGQRIVVANRAAGPGEPTGAVCALGAFSPAQVG